MNRRNTAPKRGIFIAIEGIDGAGTTTQTALLTAWLARCGIKAHRTAEPTGGPFGKHIRRLLRSRNSAIGGTNLLALLFAIDRLDHLEREIAPALRNGTWVVSDRYRLSSLAYQGIDCDPKWVISINRYAIPPDITVLIDVSPKVAMGRLSSRGSARERFESGSLLGKACENYRELAASKKEGCIVLVNGSDTIEDVSRNIRGALISFFPTLLKK